MEQNGDMGKLTQLLDLVCNTCVCLRKFCGNSCRNISTEYRKCPATSVHWATDSYVQCRL